MESFCMMSTSEIMEITKKSPGKSCKSDPIPTDLLKKILPACIDLIAEIVNQSLQIGIFPGRLKKALVKPLLKKINLELIKKNYRPVSNLEFLGKVIEKAAAKQFIEHIDKNNPMESNKAAYCKHHSMESCLLKIETNILDAIDNQKVTALILLNASAAFDTIHHDILLQRLKTKFGFRGTVLKWTES